MIYSLINIGKPRVSKVDIDFDYEDRQKAIEYLENKYGKENVCHIGTFSEMGVKSGLKDVGRVLRIPFGTMNMVTKKLDEILDKPGVKFKDFDKLKDDDKVKWEEFNKLEQEHKEIFRLARRYEGTPRNVGIHASGILVTPMPVNDMFPTRKASDGTTVTFFTGTQLEDLGAIKLDVLGLKTLTVIKKALQHINEELSFEDLYKIVDVNDAGMFDMIRKKQTDGLFQIESDLFKGLVSDIQPDKLTDIIAITSIGRPGPLSAGLHISYADRKHGREEAVEPLPNTWDIVSSSFGTIIYQEQVMQIAQRVAGFDGNQADTYLRKALAKGAKDNMALCRQWLIYGKRNEPAPAGYDPKNQDQPMYDPDGKFGAPIKGGLANGYDEEELKEFWKSLEGYSSYLFNLSHAATYSYITVLTAYLKKYYPIQFMAALLTMEENEDKRINYIKVANQMGIDIRVPDVNKSGKEFTPDTEDNAILFGFNSVKGVGETSIPDIVANRPYASLEEALNKIPKKSFNKRVGIALIKAGAFNFYNGNRYSLINEFYDLRKDKDERLDPNTYDEDACIELEREVLGTAITYRPWWDEIQPDETVERVFELIEVSERTDRNGRLMAFLTLKSGSSTIKGIVFASKYSRYVGLLDKQRNTHAIIKGKKDDKGTLIVSKVTEYKDLTELDERFHRILA